MSDELENIESHEQAEYEEDYAAPKKKSAWHGIKVFFICMGILVVFLPVFGNLIPRVFFGMPEKKDVPTKVYSSTPELKPETPTSENLPSEATHVEAEKSVSADAEIKPEIVVQSPEGEAAKPEEKPTESVAASDNLARSEKDKKIEELESKVKSLQSELEGKVNLLTLIASLKADALAGKPYNNSLNQIKFFAKDDAEVQEIIAQLMEGSEVGITPPEKLKTEFPELARLALKNKNSGFFMQYLQKFFFIRKVGEVSGDDDEAVIARAEEKLSKNNIAVAVVELSKLSADASEVFAGWVLDANKRIKLEEDLEKLNKIISQPNANIKL